MEKNYYLKLSGSPLKVTATFLRLFTMILLCGFTYNVTARSNNTCFLSDGDTFLSTSMSANIGWQSYSFFIIIQENIIKNDALKSPVLYINTNPFLINDTYTTDPVMAFPSNGEVVISECAIQEKERVENNVDSALIKYTK